MGLSEPERITGLFYDINKITGHGDSLKQQKQTFNRYDKLISLIDQLWPAFLTGQKILRIGFLVQALQTQ